MGSGPVGDDDCYKIREIGPQKGPQTEAVGRASEADRTNKPGGGGWKEKVMIMERMPTYHNYDEKKIKTNKAGRSRLVGI